MHVIAAPSNLGLRPLREHHIPGTWRAPSVLLEEGLMDALGHPRLTALERPAYSAEAQPGTRLLNGPAARRFNLELAEVIIATRSTDDFPLVIGGDCSILLGSLAGMRRCGPVSLVHVDGHSDFRHPGNYDAGGSLGAIAGMDLALATGRGEAIMTNWPNVDGSLVADEDVVQLGERESRNEHFAWPDVADTAITRIDVFEARAIGSAAVISRIRSTLDRRPRQSFWLHLDVDVLDELVMPAVDSPGSPGIEFEDLATILVDLIADRRCAGMSVSVYDPDLDQDRSCAKLIVELLGRLPFPIRGAPSHHFEHIHTEVDGAGAGNIR